MSMYIFLNSDKIQTMVIEGINKTENLELSDKKIKQRKRYRYRYQRSTIIENGDIKYDANKRMTAMKIFRKNS